MFLGKKNYTCGNCDHPVDGFELSQNTSPLPSPRSKVHIQNHHRTFHDPAAMYRG